MTTEMKTGRPVILIIADDWEALERYEEHFTRAFPKHAIECAPFAQTGVEMTLELKPVAVVLDLTVEHVSNHETLSILGYELGKNPLVKQLPVHLIESEEDRARGKREGKPQVHSHIELYSTLRPFEMDEFLNQVGQSF